jgi:hypothetical protein
MARPSEIKAVADVLMEPAEDVREVAKACIQAVDESRTDRTDYVVVSQLGRLVQGYGFFATYKQAVTAIEKQQIRTVDGSRMFVIPVIHPKAHELQQQAADAPALPEGARKMWEISRNGGAPARTHSRRNRGRRNMNRGAAT